VSQLTDYDGVRLCLRTAAITGLLFIPRANVSGQPWLWWWWRPGISPDLSTRARRQSYQQRHLEGVGGLHKGGRILRIQHLRYVNGSFTCRKILLRRTSGFASHPNEGVLWIFITVKNPSPPPGLNPWPLGPVASTLTTTPPRRQNVAITGLNSRSGHGCMYAWFLLLPRKETCRLF
jgi:hypothetical protein